MQGDETRDANRFLSACRHGYFDECAELIDRRNVPIDYRDVHGKTGLILAAEKGHLPILEFLLKRGADPESKDLWGYTAMIKAAAFGHTPIFKRLMLINDVQLTCNTFLGTVTALTEAARGGKNDILKLCLEQAPELANVPVEITGMTPLMLAIDGGHFNTVEILVKSHADLSARNTSLLSAWEMASLAGNDEILGLIAPLLNNANTVKIVVTPPTDADDELLESGFSSNKSTLTPTSRFPTRRAARQQQILSIVQHERRRSKSADKATRHKATDEFKTDGIFQHILQSNGLARYWDRFHEEEVSLKVFFTLDKTDYQSIGIIDDDVISKLLEISRHYKPLFNL